MTMTASYDRILSRRAILSGFAATTCALFANQRTIEAEARPYQQAVEKKYPLYDEATANVIPAAGYQSQISLKDCIVRLVSNGVVDVEKFLALQQYNGAMPPELLMAIDKPSDRPIRLTRENASHYVNLLWPAGLSNHLDANKESPLNGPDLPNFASTGGWTLGKEPNGGSYFNKLPIIEIKPEAEALAVRVAKSTFRPCCNNSTFFQDCNHGSALFGVLQLGAAQGLGEEELYHEALAFNSFWFPDYYIKTALYLKVARKTEWRDVDAKAVMGPDFSAGGPWQQNVRAGLESFPDLIPAPTGGANCGI